MLLGGLAVAVALQQLGYNWFAFYRARGESWPQAVESASFAGAFAVLAVPGALAGGSWGFVGRPGGVHGLRARGAARRTCGGCCRACGCGALALRAAVPVLVGDARRCWRCGCALWGGERTLAQALAELALWLAGLALATRRLEARPARRAAGLPAPGRPSARRGTRRRRRARAGSRGSGSAAAALISGFTLRRYLGPLDEGLLMQAATRMADGQWP